MHPVISSAQNPKVKHILSLEKARARRKEEAFTVEGVQEIILAIGAGYKLMSVFYCPNVIATSKALSIVRDEERLVPVEQQVFDKIAYRENSGGMIAIVRQKKHDLEEMKLSATPLLLVLESVEKPGNLGAVLRTADAARLDGVIICDPQTDVYNPNVIRASVGCVFTTPLAVTTSAAARAWLSKNNVRCLATHLDAVSRYDEQDLRVPTAIVMGTESTGLSDEWVDYAAASIIIPMRGKVDSLNVSTAAAILVFEANRQRGFR